MPFAMNAPEIVIDSAAATAQDRLAILFENGQVLVLKRQNDKAYVYLAHDADASTPELVDDICQTVSGWFHDRPTSAEVRRELEVQLHGQYPRVQVECPLVVEVYYRIFRHMPLEVAGGSPVKIIVSYSDDNHAL